MIEEVDASGAVVVSYAYGQYVDEVLHMRRGSEDYYYLHDDQYNVLGLTDDTGALVERYAYGDFGDPTIYDASSQQITESAIGNRYLFNGREWDAGLGLYHYRTRFMDPKLGRFVSRDTIGLWGDETNLGNPYTYLNNNPWSGVDPYGEGWFDDFWGWMGLQGGGDAINNRPAMAPVGTGPDNVAGLTRFSEADTYLTSDPTRLRAGRQLDLAVGRTEEAVIDMGGQIAEQQIQNAEIALAAGAAGATVQAAQKTGVFGWIGRKMRGAIGIFRGSGDDAASGVAKAAKVMDDVSIPVLAGNTLTRLGRPGRVTFEGMEIRAVRDLSHVDENTLRAISYRGFAATDIQGQPLQLHHLSQQPAGPLVEIPAPRHRINNRVQHPHGNQPGSGLTGEEREAFNEWRVRYWQERANEELRRRGLQ